MRRILLSLSFIICYLSFSPAGAQNPIIQTLYTGDPAPMVYDGVFYIHAGHDEADADNYWMHDWHVFSSTDMVNWTDLGPRLTIQDFPWIANGAWAGQCVERNGKFYWYICGREKEVRSRSVGVAVGDSPIGPFHDPIGKSMASGNLHMIDPTVFIDDDGRVYMYWGNRGLWFGELNDDMVSFKGDKFEEIPLTYEAFGKAARDEKGVGSYRDNFEEAPWLMKHGGKYFLIYAAGGVPEHISYSMADSPRGPWHYMGHLMDYFDSGSGTNHPGIAEYKGHWYFVYHTGRLPGGSGFSRSVAVEEFQWNADGTLPLILPTDKGVSPIGTLDVRQRVEAETIAWSHGVHTDWNAKTGVYVSDIHTGDSINVRVCDFGSKPATKISFSAASALQGGTIEVRLDNPASRPVAVVTIPSTGGWEEWQTIAAPIKDEVTGTHDVFFKFRGNTGARLFNLDWWKIE